MRQMGKYAVAAVALTISLSACGGEPEGPSEKDLQYAQDFCGGEGEFIWNGGMGIDEYENTEGFDRCVEDAVKVVDCLGPSSKAMEPWIPPNCDNRGYM